jgi:hypothetical protein
VEAGTPIHHVAAGQVLEATHNGGCIEAGPGLTQGAAPLAHEREELPSLHKLHEQVQVGGVLEGCMEFNKEGAVALGHQALLGLDVVHKLRLDDLLLADLLEGAVVVVPLH